MRRPSIFEIATAFEDGKNGEIKQKDKGPYETYRDLSDDEKSFVFRHPTLAYKFNNNTNKAKRMDLHNNSVGYHLGNQAIINDWSEEELLNQVINAANNGTLQIGL